MHEPLDCQLKSSCPATGASRAPPTRTTSSGRDKGKIKNQNTFWARATSSRLTRGSGNVCNRPSTTISITFRQANNIARARVSVSEFATEFVLRVTGATTNTTRRPLPNSQSTSASHTRATRSKCQPNGPHFRPLCTNKVCAPLWLLSAADPPPVNSR